MRSRGPPDRVGAGGKAEAAFPSQPLGGIDGEVVSVVEHFFEQGVLPRLLLVVHHRPARDDARPRREPDTRVGPRSELSQDEQALYDRLRTWRNGRAQADGVPPYVLLTNRQLAEVARLRPGT